VHAAGSLRLGGGDGPRILLGTSSLEEGASFREGRSMSGSVRNSGTRKAR